MDRDPNAPPAVPPPAPATHPRRDRALALLFAILLAVPLLGTFANIGPRRVPFENRNAADWPWQRAERSWHDATSAFERAFSDRMGARNPMLRLHRFANLDLFGRSPVRKVIVGDDGWLYFTGDDLRAIAQHYRGTIPFPDEDVDALVRELARRTAFLAAHGIPYVVVFVPDKATIYPEHLPGWIRRAPRSPLDRTVEALRRDGTVRFVDLRAPLAAAKARERVYFKTDSHWNLNGASVGYAAIMRAVNDALPPDRRVDPVPAPKPPFVPGVDRYAGDLAQMLGQGGRFAEDDVAPLGKLLADEGSRCARRVEGTALDSPRLVYECDRPGLPTLVMQRDSMAISLIPLLAENFRRSVFLATRRLEPAVVLAERPDVVVEEMVERTIHVPALVPMP